MELTTTTMSKDKRDATPPVLGATRDAGATALLVGLAGKAAFAACSAYAPAFAPSCNEVGSWGMLTLLSGLSAAGMWTYGFIRRSRADEKAKA